MLLLVLLDHQTITASVHLRTRNGNPQTLRRQKTKSEPRGRPGQPDTKKTAMRTTPQTTAIQKKRATAEIARAAKTEKKSLKAAAAAPPRCPPGSARTPRKPHCLSLSVKLRPQQPLLPPHPSVTCSPSSPAGPAWRRRRRWRGRGRPSPQTNT